MVYGWPVSPYTEKVVSYLRHCQVTHRCVAPTARQLRGKIRRAVGRTIMPTVENCCKAVIALIQDLGV